MHSGTPNSGKSTLFNTICGEQLALTDSVPGMTRDRKQAILWDGMVKLVDTAGVESGKTHQDINRQVKQSCSESDRILFVIDAKCGVNEGELEFAKQLKKSGQSQKVVVVANKMQGMDESELSNDVHRLGFKQVMYTSGEHGEGVLELMQEIDRAIPAEIKRRNQMIREQRKEKFKSLLKETKEEIKKELGGEVKFDFKQWEREFKRLNPNPEENSELDQDLSVDNLIRPEQSFTKGRGVGKNNPMLKKEVQIAIVGRPNVGKSSLINKLLGEDRMAVSDKPHTTTDSITNHLEYKGRKIRLVDTAGLASSNFDQNEQQLKKVQIATMNHVKFSHVVVYMLDSNSSFRILDFTFIKRIVEEGRPVVLAINKWETIKPEYRKKALAFINSQIATQLGELNGPPLVTVSAVMQEGIDMLMDQILRVYDQWNLRVSTGMLNNWLQKFKKLDNLPKDGCEQLRIRFVVQAKVRPPTFVVFANDKKLFKSNYFSFMRQKMVSEFKLQGIPIRIEVRNSKEETVKDSKKYEDHKKRKASMKQVRRREKLNDLKEKYGGFGKK